MGVGAQMVKSMVGHKKKRGRGAVCDGLIPHICNRDCWGAKRDKLKVEQNKIP